MSPAEKRYFKLYCSRHIVAGKSNHLELFNAIGRMPHFDEKALRKQFMGAPFLRRFAIAKRRLYETILDSLDAFHAKESVDDRLHRGLHHTEMLFDRGLYADAAKVLHGLRKAAKAHDRHAILLQVAEWERRTMERGNYSGTTVNTLEERAKASEAVLAQWRELEQLWLLKSRSFLLIYHSGQAPGTREMAALEVLARDPLLVPSAHLHSARARFLRHHVRSALAYVRNELAACEHELAACLGILREGPGAFVDDPDLLPGVMGNLAHVRMRMGRRQEALDGFREFRKVPLQMASTLSPDLQMKLFVMGTSLELSVLAMKGDFNEAMEHLAGLEDGLARYGERTSTMRRAELALQAAYACFGAGCMDLALRWSNRMLNEKGIAAHKELHALGRMMNMAILMDLGKTDLLAYVTRNTQRYLRQHGGVFGMESLLIKYADALSKARPGAARNTIWAMLADDLSRAAEDRREANVLDQIDLVTWARSRAGNLSFTALVKARWGELHAVVQARPTPSGPKRAA